MNPNKEYKIAIKDGDGKTKFFVIGECDSIAEARKEVLNAVPTAQTILIQIHPAVGDGPDNLNDNDLSAGNEAA